MLKACQVGTLQGIKESLKGHAKRHDFVYATCPSMMEVPSRLNGWDLSCSVGLLRLNNGIRPVEYASLWEDWPVLDRVIDAPVTQDVLTWNGIG